jgi:hypothetical protein
MAIFVSIAALINPVNIPRACASVDPTKPQYQIYSMSALRNLKVCWVTVEYKNRDTPAYYYQSQIFRHYRSWCEYTDDAREIAALIDGRGSYTHFVLGQQGQSRDDAVHAIIYRDRAEIRVFVEPFGRQRYPDMDDRGYVYYSLPLQEFLDVFHEFGKVFRQECILRGQVIND